MCWDVKFDIRLDKLTTVQALKDMLLQNFQYCWVVDPLDGTKEFIKRVPHFTVNIALLKGDTPVLGVVHTPAASTTHFAVLGQGAYVR